MMFCESCNAMINTQYTPSITTLSPDACSQQLYVVFANSTACSYFCNRMWLKTKVGMDKEIHLNDLHYTRCGMESLAIQMDVTAMCGGYYFKVNHHQLQLQQVLWCVDVVYVTNYCNVNGEDTSTSTTPSLTASGNRRLMSSLLGFGN